jgi:magnesium-transporting ATPase (P-type)
VKVENNETVPADLIILATSELNGEAYCSTASLDGERTLKSKFSLPFL